MTAHGRRSPPGTTRRKHRARLNGTDVNQHFITVLNASIMIGVAVNPGRYD